MSDPKVMLLIDADNVSVDVIQQAFERVLAQHGAVHVRRAYCNAESAVRHLALFKALSIRPIVNVSTGKNSTDIALAVDAISLVEAERPDLVVIVSSDSDFAPLVIRLREKGCRVEGIGQKGKTGGESVVVYDDFIDIEHRRANGNHNGSSRPSAPRDAGRGRGGRGRSREAGSARDAGAPRQAAGREAPPAPPPADAHTAPRKSSSRGRGRGRRAPAVPDDDNMPLDFTLSAEMLVPPDDGPADAELPPPVIAAAPAQTAPVPPAENPAPPAKPARTGRSARAAKAAATDKPAQKSAENPPEEPAEEASEKPAAAQKTRAPAKRGRRAAATDDVPAEPEVVAQAAPVASPPASTKRLPEEVIYILEAVPELVEGGPVDLGLAADRLRNVRMLSKSAPSTRLFRLHPDHFVLTPEKQPNQVEYRGPAPW